MCSVKTQDFPEIWLLTCNEILPVVSPKLRILENWCTCFSIWLKFMKMSRKLPLVVILGATGSGKTKLSLQLAQKFGGEIIGADSMQVYKCLDIITAKATKEEQKMCPHHMINILEPHEVFSVTDYRNRAVKIIDGLFSQDKLPIVVGGTNYYIESLLWKILIDAPQTDATQIPDEIHTLTSEELHERLKLLDPEMARRLHPNNKRKILRSLEILYQKGRKHSDLLAEQQKSQGGSEYGGGLRYSNALIFRLECEKSVLDERLNKRVDSMMEQGLVQELENFHKVYLEKKQAADYTKGVFQSIGFKEFHEYLMLGGARGTEEGRKIFAQCVENLKMVTRRYARKQNKWTTNRFLGKRNREVPPMYGLDVGDLSEWDRKVVAPAVQVVDNFISGNCDSDAPKPLPPREDVNSNPMSLDESFFCDICERPFVGLYQWRLHLKSHKHKRVSERKKRTKATEEVS